MRLHPVLLLSVLMIGCRTAPAPSPETTPEVDREALEAGCATRLDGGQRVQRPDGVSLWFKDTGPRDAPVLLFLHGGPGYNSYTFEKSAGPLLETQLRVIYLDQRGSGRSWRPDGRTPTKLGMQATLDDVEALREHLGVDRWFVAGHSFGGVVAVEYARAHRNRTRGVIAIETGSDVGAALQNQVDALARLAPERFPEHAVELQANARPGAPIFERMARAYDLLGRLPLQAAIHYASPDSQTRMERWDADSGLNACGSRAVAGAYAKEGFLGGGRPELNEQLPVPGVLFGGRHSEVIGARSLEAAARAWGVPLRWFEHSGHFVYLEEPQAFADAVSEFVQEYSAPPPLPAEASRSAPTPR